MRRRAVLGSVVSKAGRHKILPEEAENKLAAYVRKRAGMNISVPAKVMKVKAMEVLI